MNPASSDSNQGSINFDAQALHDADEEEYQREEAERQNELRHLLTCAFDCDLSEEEDSLEENTSQTTSSHNVSHQNTEGDPLEEGDDWQNEGQYTANQQAFILGGGGIHSSTPVNGLAPPLATPATNRYPYPNQQQDTYMTPNLPQEFEGHQLIQRPYIGGLESNPGYMIHPQQPQQLQQQQQQPEAMLPERGEIEGANVNDNIPHPMPSGMPHQNYLGNYQGYHYHQRPDVYDGQEANQQQFTAEHYTTPTHDTEPIQPWTSVPKPTELQSPRASYQSPPHPSHDHKFATQDIPSSPRSPPEYRQYPNKELENFRVKYTGTPQGDVSTDLSASESELGNTLPRPNTPGDEGSQMQRDFLALAEGNTDMRQYAQLEILYRARGNKIEELIKELKQVKDDSDREIRILKHKVTLIEGERDGMRNSLEQSQKLLQESKCSEQTLLNNVSDLEQELGALGAQKLQILEKLGTAESSIENLNMQLMEVGSSETLARVRDQHEATVSGMTQKHDSEILTLKQQLDALSADNQHKSEAVNDLKKQVATLTRDLEIKSVDQAETVNKLTRSLEESQRQNRDLLDTDGLGNRSVGQEAAKLKLQVQEAIASKSVTEDINSALQEEVKELKEQLTMYESASQFGVTSSVVGSVNEATAAASSASHLDDSYAQLGIRKSTSPVDDSGDVTTTEAVHGLKKELERCLSMYKSKREQLTEVQAELKDVKAKFEENKHKMERTEKELQETKVKLSLREMSRSGASSLKEVRLQKEMDKVLNEKENLRIEVEEKLNGYVKASECGANSLKEARLQLDLKKITQEKEATLLQLGELRQRLDEISSNEERLTEVNRELQSQMSQIVKDFDQDKTQAVQKCREACLQHHEDTKEKMRIELIEKHSSELEEQKKLFEEEMDKLKNNIKAVQDELDEVKELYVSVCKAKDDLEDTLNTEWENKLHQQIKQKKEQLNQDKQSELEAVKTALTSEHQSSLAVQREKWLKEQEGEFNKKLEEKVEESRIAWQDEHQDEKENAVLSAVEAAVAQTQQEEKEKWTEILEEEHNKVVEDLQEEADHKLQEARLKWNTDKRVSFERELQERLKAAKDTWTANELPQQLEHEQRKWHRELLGDSTLEEKLNKTVNDAKKEWRLKEKKHRDHSENKIRELSKLVVDVEAKVEKANWELKQELNQTRSDKKNLEKQVSDLEEEKQQIIHDKDQEKRQAVKEIEDQCEKDYKLFVEEHKDTLNKALKSARQQFDQVKEDMAKTHMEELENLNKKLEEEIKTHKNVVEEKESAEVSWQDKVDSLIQQHREDRETLLNTHRDNLHQSLEEARSKWQQQQESLQAERDSLAEKEQDWEEERAGYQGELLRLEQLLQSADEHMETEIAKLHEELSEAHKKEIEEKMNKEVEKVEDDLTDKLSVISQEKQQLGNKLEDTRSLLKELEAKYKKDTANLAEKARAYKHDLQATRKELEVKWQAQEGAESQKDEITQRLKDTARQLDKSERMRQEIIESYKKAETEHTQIVHAYKARQNELNEKIQSLEKEVKGAQVETQKQLIIMQESMEREQTAALEKMKTKISEMRAGHKVSLETAKKEYASEKQQLRFEIDTLQNQRRSMTTTPTQTDQNNSGVLTDSALEEIRKHYIRAVAKVKKDVVKHVKNSNELAAETVKIEVLKERQKTAKRLRKYYMHCLSDLLDKDCDQENKEQKMLAMEKALDSVPESGSTSRTMTPSTVEQTPRSGITGSSVMTPVNMHLTQRRERSHDRTPNSRASAHSSHSHVSGQHSIERSGGSRSRSNDRRSREYSHSPTRHREHTHQPQSSAYYKTKGHGSGGSTTTTITPCETPIEDVIKRVTTLRNEQLSYNSRHRTGHKHHSHRHHHLHQQNHSHSNSRYPEGRDILRSRSGTNLDEFGLDNSRHSSTHSRTSQDSVGYRTKGASNYDNGPDMMIPSRDETHHKRTSFGVVTKYPISPNKHPSESNIFQKVNSHQHSEISYRGKKHYDASITSLDSYCAGGDSMLDGGKSVSGESNKLADSSIDGIIASAPSSPPKQRSTGRGGSYKYTSLRNTRGSPSKGFSTLSKAMSTSNITDRNERSSLGRNVYNVPENLFGDIPQMSGSISSKKRNNRPSDREEWSSDHSTPTNLTNFIASRDGPEKLRNRHHGDGDPPLRKPTPKKAATSRSSSESRLPKPRPTLQSNNNNNNISDIQSTGSSFEKYSSPPRETTQVASSTPITHQGSMFGHTYMISAEKDTEDHRQTEAEAGVTGVRLSWENPPSAYNLTLYSSNSKQ